MKLILPLSEDMWVECVKEGDTITDILFVSCKIMINLLNTNIELCRVSIYSDFCNLDLLLAIKRLHKMTHKLKTQYETTTSNIYNSLC